MTTLYDELHAAGCRIGNHESDLYVKADDVSRPIVHAAVKAGRLATKPTIFQSTHPEDMGAIWYEIPFAYSPFWRSRGLDTRSAETHDENGGTTGAPLVGAYR